MDKDYKIDESVNVVDWMIKPNLMPVGNNFEKLLKGFLETPGRIPQPSYNFYVISSCEFLPYASLKFHWVFYHIVLDIQLYVQFTFQSRVQGSRFDVHWHYEGSGRRSTTVQSSQTFVRFSVGRGFRKLGEHVAHKSKVNFKRSRIITKRACV